MKLQGSPAEGHMVLLHRPWEFTVFQMATATCSRGMKQPEDGSAKGSSCLKALHQMRLTDHKKGILCDGKNYDLV